jgi:cell shape-determining protein MreC
MLKKQHIRPDLYNNFIMEIQDKTKDELITELNELLKKTNYLKVQNETLTAELLVANEKLFFQKKSASLLIIPTRLLSK